MNRGGPVSLQKCKIQKKKCCKQRKGMLETEIVEQLRQKICNFAIVLVAQNATCDLSNKPAEPATFPNNYSVWIHNTSIQIIRVKMKGDRHAQLLNKEFKLLFIILICNLFS